jgi:hypothetical protein
VRRRQNFENTKFLTEKIKLQSAPERKSQLNHQSEPLHFSECTGNRTPRLPRHGCQSRKKLLTVKGLSAKGLSAMVLGVVYSLAKSSTDSCVLNFNFELPILATSMGSALRLFCRVVHALGELGVFCIFSIVFFNEGHSPVDSPVLRDIPSLR